MGYKVPQLVPFVGDEELANLKQVIQKQWLTEGPFAEEFVSLIKDKTGAKYAVLANNGTLALFIALKAIGIKDGDEIIIPNITFIASATSAYFAGATPVFVDVDPNTLNIDVTQLEKLITSKTKAIMPVHVYGQAADMDPILDIAKKYNIKVIEDAAQGYGVEYKGKHTGTIGDVGTISFFADKTVTCGEGAVVLTNNEEIYNTLKLLRNQGRPNSGTFIHPFLGMNFRMTDLQCAVGVAQLKKFDKIIQLKTKNYDLYYEKLKNVKEISFVEIEEYSNFIPFRVNIKVDKKEELIQYLEENKIQTRTFFYPLHRQPCFEYLKYKIDDFPISNRVFNEGLSLAIFPGLEVEQIELVTDTIIEFFNKD
ncbi:MAG: DegT/DnrJ/EryC1/StrS family aminotransferase [Bacteroidetes bacterium]|nr:DegT/DnrJ/EryC1/StrS family aminotransferase [Bacteroidota bacterium]